MGRSSRRPTLFKLWDWNDSDAARGVSVERPELDLAVKDLGSLGLEQNLHLGHAGVGSVIDHHAVDHVGDLVAVADDLDGVPLAGRLLGVGLLDLSLALKLAVDHDGGAVDQPEVAAIVLLDLALDRFRPNL